MQSLVISSPKLSFDTIAQSVGFMKVLGQDQTLENRKLQVDEIQKIIRFVNAVADGRIKALLPENALTLWRAIPGLKEAKSEMTVHRAVMVAGETMKKLYANAPENSPERQKYHDLFVQTGMICMDRRLVATTEENRIKEFEMFRPFIGETPEYRGAMERFLKRRTAGLRRRLSGLCEAPVTPFKGNITAQIYQSRKEFEPR